MDKIKTIVDKEWAEVFKNKLVLFSVAFLPLLLTALPIIMLATTQDLTTEEMTPTSATSEDLEELPDEFLGDMCVDLSEADCVQVYMLNILHSCL